MLQRRKSEYDSKKKRYSEGGGLRGEILRKT